ncbi:MAG: SH3 domain-containing protein [Bauldia sp.]|nr:SH3 domain-containing protein [Bauldia sp.]
MLALLAVASSAAAQQRRGPVTDLPLPRFVSLNSDRVNVRVGPGSDYPVAWIYVRLGLPVEVVEEVDNWRKIRDSNGDEGWVFYSLLSGERTAIVAPNRSGPPLPLRAQANETARIVAYLDPGVQGSLESCRNGWCRLRGPGFNGWIPDENLWGVYPNEAVD